MFVTPAYQMNDLIDYDPKERNPDGMIGLRLAQHLVSKGWPNETIAEFLYGNSGAIRTFTAAQYMWMRAISQARFGSPECAVQVETRLMNEVSRIRDEVTRKHYIFFIKERLQATFGFYDHRVDPVPKVVLLAKYRPRSDPSRLLKALENSERIAAVEKLKGPQNSAMINANEVK